MFAKYIKTAAMSAQNKTLAGIFYLLPDALLRVVCLIPLMMLWRILMSIGVSTGMQLSQMLTYTYVSALLSEILVLLSPLFGVSLIPATLWFFPSLLLCISLGLAAEFLFTCLFIRMVNARWLAYTLRKAVMSLFAGNLIPFAVMPWEWEPSCSICRSEVSLPPRFHSAQACQGRDVQYHRPSSIFRET